MYMLPNHQREPKMKMENTNNPFTKGDWNTQVQTTLQSASMESYSHAWKGSVMAEGVRS